jgi:hypothetical protein
MPIELTQEMIQEIWDKIINAMLDVPGGPWNIDGVEIKAVNGDEVKLAFDMDFIEGGNGMRYEYIPQDEIWVDQNQDLHNWPSIALHEFIERMLMKDFMPYEQAHELANQAEKQARNGELDHAD